MKQITLMFILLLIILTACSGDPKVEGAKILSSEILTHTIDLCNSLCNTDENAYCEEQRTITVNGKQVTGTCRAFSRTGAGIGVKVISRAQILSSRNDGAAVGSGAPTPD